MQLPQLCPHLTSLSLEGTRLTDAVLQTVTASCPPIAHLDIMSNYLLTDEGIRSMTLNLKCLQSLNVMENYLTDASLNYFSTNCVATLHTIYISCSDGGFSAIAVNELLVQCAKLHTLGIFASCPSLLKCLEFVQPSVKTLIKVILGGKVFRNNNIAAIATYGACLDVLSIDETVGCSSKKLVSLIEGCPKLRKLVINLKRTDEMLWYAAGDSNVYEVISQARDLWKVCKPELEVIESLSGQGLLDYDVMEM